MNIQLRKLRYYLRYYLPAKLFNKHEISGKPDILLFSTPRSGSTWLMEIISSQSDIKFVNEPFHINRHKTDLTKIEPNWENIFNFENKCIFKEYLADILNEKNFLGQQRLKDIFLGNYKFRTKRKIVKILRLKGFINYFEKYFNVQVIYLVRHPLAVSLSWLNNDYNDKVKLFLEDKEYIEKYLNNDLLVYIKNVYQKGSDIDKYVLQWSLENLPPLNFFDNNKWLIISYEELVLEPEKSLKKLYRNLNLSDYDKLFKHINKPSRTTQDVNTKNNIIDEEKRYLVEKWEESITKEQIRSAFEILDNFNIDIYTNSDYTMNKNSKSLKK